MRYVWRQTGKTCLALAESVKFGLGQLFLLPECDLAPEMTGYGNFFFFFFFIHNPQRAAVGECISERLVSARSCHVTLIRKYCPWADSAMLMTGSMKWIMPG